MVLAIQHRLSIIHFRYAKIMATTEYEPISEIKRIVVHLQNYKPQIVIDRIKGQSHYYMHIIAYCFTFFWILKRNDNIFFMPVI